MKRYIYCNNFIDNYRFLLGIPLNNIFDFFQKEYNNNDLFSFLKNDINLIYTIEPNFNLPSETEESWFYSALRQAMYDVSRHVSGFNCPEIKKPLPLPDYYFPIYFDVCNNSDNWINYGFIWDFHKYPVIWTSVQISKDKNDIWNSEASNEKEIINYGDYFVNIIMSLSSSTDVNKVLLGEWLFDFDYYYDNKNGLTCDISKDKHRYLYSLKNTVNGNEIAICHKCISLFKNEVLDNMTKGCEDFFKFHDNYLTHHVPDYSLFTSDMIWFLVNVGVIGLDYARYYTKLCNDKNSFIINKSRFEKVWNSRIKPYIEDINK